LWLALGQEDAVEGMLCGFQIEVCTSQLGFWDACGICTLEPAIVLWSSHEEELWGAPKTIPRFDDSL